uniref:Hydroxylysine kinase n=1 Tax=Knipowitschia caucasica TaxID=637954 RepID=A0AAV2KQX8_KNICA
MVLRCDPLWKWTNVYMDLQQRRSHVFQDCGLPVQVALRNTAEERLSFEELDCGHGHQTYCVRLLDYMPGVTVSESAVTQEDLYDVGRMGAALSRAMLKIEHPNLDVLNLSANKAWDIGHIHLVEQYLSVMDGDPVQDIIKEVIQGIKSQVLPKLGSFPTGITHGDFSDQNILVSPVGNGHHKVSGIIDFTFLCRKCFVNEVAVSIAYLMVENPSPLNVGGAVLAGWESLIPLSDDERDCLFLLVLGRLCQSLVYGRHNSLQSSENKDYFLTKSLWQQAVKELGLEGKVTHKQVSKKWENLKKRYKDLRDPKTGSGTDSGEKTASNWPYYAVLHAVLGGRPAVDPPVVVASFRPAEDPTALLMAIVNPDETPSEDTQLGSASSAPSTRKRKRTDSQRILDFLQAESDKEQRRHEESEEKTLRFLSLFERMVEKL